MSAPPSAGVIGAPIVMWLRWGGTPYPGAVIGGHTGRFRDLGLVFFGGLLITGTSRRLTLARLELGSIDGGYASAVDVDANGGWSP